MLTDYPVIIFDAHTRTQLIFAVASALSQLTSPPKTKIIVTHGAPFGKTPDFTGFDFVFKHLLGAIQHDFVERDKFNASFLKKINIDRRPVAIFSTSRMPVLAILACVLSRSPFLITRTEEGIGSYGGVLHNASMLFRNRYYFWGLRSILGFLVSKGLSGPLKIRNSFLIGDDLQINDRLKSDVVTVIRSLCDRRQGSSVDDLPPAGWAELRLFDPLKSAEGQNIGPGQDKIILKLHPRVGIRPDDLPQHVSVYDGYRTCEELVHMSQVRRVVGPQSSALIYSHILYDVESVNLTNRFEDPMVCSLFSKFTVSDTQKTTEQDN